MQAAAPQIKTPLWWSLAGLCALLLLLQLFLGVKYLTGDPYAASHAVKDAQRVWLSIEQSADPALGETTAPSAPLPAALPKTDDLAASSQQPVTSNALIEEFATTQPAAEETAETVPEETQESPASGNNSFVAAEEDLLDVIPAEPRTAVSLAAPDDA